MSLLLCLLLAPPLQVDLDDYFADEHALNGTYVATGALQAGLGTWTLLSQEERVQGAGGPLIGIGVVQLGFGIGYLVYGSALEAEYGALYAKDPEAYRRQELARVAPLHDLFDWFFFAEALAVVGGIATWTVANAADDPFLEGLGAGIAWAGLLQLVGDGFAEHIAGRHRRALEATSRKAD